MQEIHEACRLAAHRYGYNPDELELKLLGYGRVYVAVLYHHHKIVESSLGLTPSHAIERLEERLRGPVCGN